MKLLNWIALGALCCCGLEEVAAVSIERTLPDAVAGVEEEVLLLNGEWELQFSKDERWEKVTVPGELAMQGFGIEHDKPVLYRKKFRVPSDFSGKRMILRFDGVYSYARLWVNGKYVTEHSGGFTRWENDVTEYLTPGKKNEIRLEVTDKINDISYASGYAHHPIGGILRDVTLYTLPEAHLQNFFVETLLDEAYKDAVLHIHYVLPKTARVSFSLKDADGNAVSLPNAEVTVSAGENDHRFPVKRPLLWDAEHPHLYKLQVSVEADGESYSFEREIGFRKIEIKGDRMLVNGKQVKLRGACRHDIHPTLGRVSTAETDSLDALLFKRANMNFVRTSHYPPTERFLKYCDRTGIYVECETAVCFVDTHRQKNYAPARSQDDPLFTDNYLNQLEEMVNTARSHTSVLFWSIGNESVYGKNFQLSYDWLKQEDTTRPVIFSYPGIVKEDKKVYDILSMHYPGCDGTMTQYNASTVGFQGGGIPALFDEWAHVPCYTYTTLQDDPNIREFWGISLDKMWSKLFDAPGGLGGAIWGYVDETFMLPEPKRGTAYWIEFARTAKPADFQGNCVGYGEWGIVDVWRREKPEFWGTKKAYSPVKVLQTQVDDFIDGASVSLAVYNRFDHTNLNELTATVTYEGEMKQVMLPDLHPHEKGLLTVPAFAWKEGDSFLIEFFDAKGELIDAEQIQIGQMPVIECSRQIGKESAVQVKETDDFVVFRGRDFEIPFNKQTGLIENALSKGQVVIEKGPFLNLDLNVNHKTGPEVREKARSYTVADKDWQKDSFSYQQEGNHVRVILEGHYAGISVLINFLIEADGTVSMDYRTKNEPNGWLREAGLKLYLPDLYEEVSWNRKGYWSYYPKGSFAGNSGTAPLYNSVKVAYGANPDQPWNMDTHNYYYFADAGAVCKRPLTNQAKGMKENIYTYTLSQKDKDICLQIVSSRAGLGCRLNKTPAEELVLYMDNRWDYPEIAWGDYCKALDVVPVYGTVRIRL